MSNQTHIEPQHQGFHLVFVQEVSGVILPGIFSFSYDRK